MGRPKIEDVNEIKVGHSVTISPRTAAYLRLIGKNNLSRGIQSLADEAQRVGLLGVNQKQVNLALKRNPNGLHNVDEDIFG